MLEKIFMKGKKKLFPQEIKEGQILYAEDENGLYLDNESTRDRLNPPADWNETNESSPAFIQNKPVITSHWNIIVDLDSLTWEDVVSSQTYADDYKLGMTLPVNIEQNGKLLFSFNMQLVAFDTDIRADGDNSINNGKVRMTWISKEITGQSSMFADGSTGSTDDWASSSMREMLVNNIYPLLPDIIRENIVEVTKTSTALNSDNNELFTQVTSDKLWIPSVNEVYNNITNLENEEVSYKSIINNNLAKISIENTPSGWFLRSHINSQQNGQFFYIDENGSLGQNSASALGGIIFGFCL